LLNPRTILAAGPIFTSVANFVMSISTVKHLSAAEYGFLAFSLTLQQLGFNLVNALGGMPASLVLNDSKVIDRRTLHAIGKVIIFASWAGGAIVAACGASFHVQIWGAVTLGVSTLIGLARWYLRLLSYAEHRPRASLQSDAIYSVAMVAGVGLMLFTHGLSLRTAAAIVLLANLAALTSFLRKNSIAELLAAVRAPLAPYLPVWSEHSRWTLASAVATELTANAHVYLVTLGVGPHAFAPLAVATLLWRPTATIYTSLLQLERPAMARHLSAGELAKAVGLQSTIRVTIGAAWLANLCAVGMVFFVFYHQLIGPSYDRRTVALAMVFYGGVMACRAWRVPETVFVQAARQTRRLAQASLFTAPISLVLAAALTFVAGPVFSLLGIIVGDSLMGVRIGRLAAEARKKGVVPSVT